MGRDPNEVPFAASKVKNCPEDGNDGAHVVKLQVVGLQSVREVRDGQVRSRVDGIGQTELSGHGLF